MKQFMYALNLNPRLKYAYEEASDEEAHTETTRSLNLIYANSKFLTSYFFRKKQEKSNYVLETVNHNI